MPRFGIALHRVPSLTFLVACTILTGTVAAKPVLQKTNGVSTATITHKIKMNDPGGSTGDSPIDVNKTGPDANFTTSTNSNKAQYRFRNNKINNTITLNSGSSTSTAGIAYRQTKTSAEPMFSAGTGVDQDDPLDEILDDSGVTIDFDMVFKIRSSDFDTVLASMSLIYAGTVGENGHVGLDGSVDYYRTSDKTVLGTIISSAPLTFNYQNDTQGAFEESLFGSAILTDTIPKNEFLRIKGNIEFIASNQDERSGAGFAIDFPPVFNTQGNLRVDRLAPGIINGQFSNPLNWSEQQSPGSTSIVDLDATTMGTSLNVEVDNTTQVKRIDLGGNSTSQQFANLKILTRNTLTVDDLAVRDGGALMVEGGATLVTGRTLIDGQIDFGPQSILNVASGTMGVTGAVSSTDVMTKTGPGSLVLYGNNTTIGDLSGQINIEQGNLQLQRPTSGGTADFAMARDGVVSANFNFQQNFVNRIKSSEGTLALVRRDVTNPLDFNEHPNLFLGAIDHATVTGPIRPGVDINTRIPTYRFGGQAGGQLNVVSDLIDFTDTPTDVLISGPDNLIVLSGNNTFSGNLAVENGARIGLDCPTTVCSPLPSTATLNVDFDGLVYQTAAIDSSNAGGVVNLTGTTATTGLAQVGWAEDKTITNLNQVGNIVGTGPSRSQTRILGLGASGDAGTLTLSIDISDDATSGGAKIDGGTGNDVIGDGSKDDTIDINVGGDNGGGDIILGDNGVVNLKQSTWNGIYTTQSTIVGGHTIAGGTDASNVITGDGSGKKYNLRLVKSGESTLDLRGRNNTYTGGTLIRHGTVLADSFDNFGFADNDQGLAVEKLVEIEPHALLLFNSVTHDQVRDAIKDGRGRDGDWTGANGITSPTAISNPARGAVGSFDDGKQIHIAFAQLGDNDLDGEVLGNDYDTTAKNFTGPGGTSKRWQDGDTDYDDDVDNADLQNLLAHENLSLDEPLEDIPTNGTLVYNMSNGNVNIKTKEMITNFILHNCNNEDFSQPIDFNFGAFTPPTRSGLVTNSALEISWSDIDGFTGTAKLGKILPSKLKLDQVLAVFTEHSFVGDTGAGIHNLSVRVKIPEPSAGGLLLSLMLLGTRRRVRRS